ncbi:hypothetical protein STEG23_008069, partial [Scotinomys teguina]
SEKKSLASRSNVTYHSKVTSWSGSLSSAMRLMPGRPVKDPECRAETLHQRLGLQTGDNGAKETGTFSPRGDSLEAKRLSHKDKQTGDVRVILTLPCSQQFLPTLVMVVLQLDASASFGCSSCIGVASENSFHSVLPSPNSS